jgi:hypothetical protein
MAPGITSTYRSHRRVRTRTRLYSEIDRTKKELEEQFRKTQEIQGQIQKEKEELLRLQEQLLTEIKTKNGDCSGESIRKRKGLRALTSDQLC